MAFTTGMGRLMLGVRRARWAAALLAASLALPAQAGIFDDDDARRAILELRQQRTQDHDANAARQAAVDAQLEQVKRSLLDINATLEQLRSDLAAQRGQIEVLQRDVADLQRRQKDAQSALDERVKKLEPQSVTMDGKTFQADPDEKREFDEALARLRAADFAAAATALQNFLQHYPNTGYLESANYWLGNAYYGQKLFKEAIAAFSVLTDRFPEHARAPESMLSVANCRIELKETDSARKTLEQVIKRYPDSEAAQAARDRLASLGSTRRHKAAHATQ